MEIIESGYSIKLSHREMQALAIALRELEILQIKYPDERNGFDLGSQGIIGTLKVRVRESIGMPPLFDS